jgi:hypothetical protein
MSLVGERKAVAALALAAFTTLFTINALVAPPGLAWLFAGLGLVYGVGFFGLVSGWFWARWYALGLGFSGVAMAVMIAFQMGLDPTVWIWGIPHVLVMAGLLGRHSAAAFDGRPDWRERFRLDDNAVHRLGKSVTRAGASLPYLVMAALAPRESGEMLIAGLLGVAAVTALIKLRGWAPIALVGSAAALVTLGGGTIVGASSVGLGALPLAPATLAAALLVGAALPLAGPVWRFLRD